MSETDATDLDRDVLVGVPRSVGAVHLGVAGMLHIAVGLALLSLAAIDRLQSIAFNLAVDVLTRTSFLTDTALLARWPDIETAATLTAVLSPLLTLLGARQLVAARDILAGSTVPRSVLVTAVCSPVSIPLGVIAAVLLWVGNWSLTKADRQKTHEVALVGGVLLVAYTLCLAPIATMGGVDSGMDEPDNVIGFDGTGDMQFRVADAGLNYRGADTLRGANGMISNAGVYVLNYDGDGYEDVVLIGGEKPVLYQNTGDGFRRSGTLPDIEGPIRGMLAFDYNFDGHEDLFVMRPNASAVLLANRGGSFERVENSLTRRFPMPIGATVADYDGNGCPDVFVFQYGDWMDEHPAGERNYNVSKGEDNGYRNRLFLGNCSGFREATNGSGIRGTKWTLAASSADLTRDGRPDIHVANDFNYDFVYVNRGNASFERIRLGERTNRNGMSSEIADFTGDGRPDVFTMNIYFPTNVEDEMATTMRFRADGNNLLINQGNTTFVDRAAAYGVKRGGWGWAAVAADFDNDGRLDIFHTTRNMSFRYTDNRFSAAERRLLHTAYPFYRYPTLFEGNGSTFTVKSTDAAGFHPADGRGTVGFDYDRDGDIDLLVADAGGKYRLYENTGTDGNGLQVDVRNAVGGTALGATVSVTTANRTRHRTVTARADFLSQDSRVLHFGFERTPRGVVTIRWPDGRERIITDIRPGIRLDVSPEGPVRRIPFNASVDS